MKPFKIVLLTILCGTPALVLLGVDKSKKPAEADPVTRGKYLVAFGGCNDCHTPFKSSDKGFVPDRARMLSGHPSDTKLLPPDLNPGPWSAITAGNTAWAGPWGITYSSNLTPDTNTGLGIWTEEMFLKAMRTGKHMGAGRDIRPPMPWQSLAALDDDDLKAIYAYLRTLPAIRNEVPLAVSPGENDNFE